MSQTIASQPRPPAQPFKVAAIQMVSGTDVDENLATAAHWIAQAAQAGAKLVVLPEYFCLMGERDQDKVKIREPYGAGPIQTFLATQARQHGTYLVGGTLPLAAESPAHVWNSTLVYDPQGQLICRYDKIHLFGFSHGEERYDEAQSIAPGSQPQAFDTPIGRVGLSICYDLRFPELYRHLNQVTPINLLLVPAAFTHTTGQAHWEVLLRARAIENQCYVLAAAQGGLHQNRRQTWGHSMLIDPWGKIVAEHATGPGLVCGEIDINQLDAIRARLPALQHRKL